jgi:hypothetical protein
MSKTFVFITGEKIEVVADNLDEAMRLVSLGEYEEIETETLLLEEIDNDSGYVASSVFR